jgi:hypothetical protein
MRSLTGLDNDRNPYAVTALSFDDIRNSREQRGYFIHKSDHGKVDREFWIVIVLWTPPDREEFLGRVMSVLRSEFTVKSAEVIFLDEGEIDRLLDGQVIVVKNLYYEGLTVVVTAGPSDEEALKSMQRQGLLESKLPAETPFMRRFKPSRN